MTQDEQSTMFETPPKAALKPALKKPATKAPAGKGKMTVATKKKMEVSPIYAGRRMQTPWPALLCGC